MNINSGLKWEISDTHDLDKYSEQILKIYSNSYEKIGLIDFGGWNGMKNYLNCSCYLLKNETDEIYGIILYWLSEYGNKISLVISSSPSIGKEFVIPKLIELLHTPGFFIELSDALEHIIRKNGLDNIKDKEIIKKIIPQLKDEDIFDEGDERCNLYPLNKNKSPSGSYLRNIKDVGIHRKAIYGIPCLNKKFNNFGCNRMCIMDGGKIKTIKKHKRSTYNKKHKRSTYNKK